MSVNTDRDLTISDFDYELPKERIAYFPLNQRDKSKLLVYQKGAIKQQSFFDLPDLLPKNSLLIFNNTKVIYARLLFKKITGAQIEIFCLSPSNDTPMQQALESTKNSTWTCMIGNYKKWKEEELLVEKEGLELRAIFKNRSENGVEVCFEWNEPGVNFAEILHIFGDVPLPPYLSRESTAQDKTSYQTIFAHIEGSVAAPTAGLHFTDKVLDSLKVKNINTDFVTLHVGAGTFLPVKSTNIGGHVMHAEKIIVSKKTIEKIMNNETIIPVGTTSMRTLESLYLLGMACKDTYDLQNFSIPQWAPNDQHFGEIHRSEALQNLLNAMDKQGINEIQGATQIMITPSYKPQLTDALITNFHQPKSTLLLLIASLVGKNWQGIYNYALNNGFRFLSYGDSSLLFNDNN